MDNRDVGAVVQVAAGLQRRLNQLTSTWTNAPVELHRLQETVSRAYTILQSILQSILEPSMELDSNRRPVHEKLSSHLAMAKQLLDDIVDIL